MTSPAAATQAAVAPWMLAGLTGAGGVLAGSMVMLLRRRRRSQFRSRRPGRTITAPEPLLAPVEKSITVLGGITAPTVEFMDDVLRRLAAGATQAHRAMPEVAAVQLTDTDLVLHLGEAAAMDPPWSGSAEQLHWSLSTTADVDAVGPQAPDQPAPYPMLVTVGADDAGHVWLLNLEDLDVSITGDAAYAADLARYLVAEIACNPWSAVVTADCVGIAEEVGPMDPGRIRVHEPTDAGHTAAEILTDAVRALERLRDLGGDIATARAGQAGEESWTARLLIIDAEHADSAAVRQLLDLVHEHAGHTGTAVVINGERPDTPGVVLHLSAAGRLTMPQAGLDLVAVGLTSDAAQGCAAVLAQSETLQDAPMPVDEHAEQGWRALTNQAGALREEHTMPRGTDLERLDEPASRVLDAPDQEYLTATATTEDDLQALAPVVTTSVRAKVEDADPSLGEDLAAWFSPSCPLPRLTLLGPVGARTRGVPVTKRKPYWTEILAYLATRPHGATPEELADAFDITPAKARDYVRIVREWLGVNPRTGGRHLPDAREAPAAQARGMGVYQVLDVLVDADLFRRLRARGQARGADGIEDLRTALRLVQGRPFDKLRKAGWGWLAEGDRLDQHMICAIVDVAHILTAHAIQTGDLKDARLAAETAALAAPDEEIPRLDLAAVAAAEGHHSEAQRIVRDQICNRSDDGGAPAELPARTERILEQHDWLSGGKVAS